jgi:hypothetical protein
VKRTARLGRLFRQTATKRAVACELNHLSGIGDFGGNRIVVGLSAPDRLHLNIFDQLSRICNRCVYVGPIATIVGLEFIGLAARIVDLLDRQFYGLVIC